MVIAKPFKVRRCINSERSPCCFTQSRTREHRAVIIETDEAFVKGCVSKS